MERARSLARQAEPSRYRWIRALVLGAVCVACGCSAHSSSVLPVPAEPLLARAVPDGLSGMAPVGARAFVVVHDVKDSQPGRTRLGLVSVDEEGAVGYQPIAVAWGPRVSSDLESACALPGRADEILASESWGGGCMFHARIHHGDEAAPSADLLGCIPIPHDVVEMEGLACTVAPDGAVWLVLGERGGEPGANPGRLRWGTLDLAAHTFVERGRTTVRSPTDGRTDLEHQRHVADLWLDRDATLWSAGTEDPGDAGPFRSVLYRLGRFGPDPSHPSTLTFSPVSDPQPLWFEGLKVEAVSAPVGAGARFSVGTDDEALVGVWRPVR